jgi:hypothetical protein
MTIILMTVAKPSLPLKTLQVLIDPTVVGSLRSDLTAETCPPIELLPVAPLRTSKLGSDLHADYDRKEITFNLPPKT